MRCEARPPSTLQEFLEEIAALSRAGLITRGGLPRRPRALLAAAALAERHRDMVTLLFPPLPPPSGAAAAVPAARAARPSGAAIESRPR